MFNSIDDIVEYTYSLIKDIPIDEVMDFVIPYLDSLKTFKQFDEVAVIQKLMETDKRFFNGEAVGYETIKVENINYNGNIHITRQLAKQIKEEGLYLRLTYFRKA